MKASVVTARRSSRLIEVSTIDHRGRPSISIQAQWEDHHGQLHTSGAAVIVPATALDEVIALLISAGNEINGAGGDGDV